MSRRATTLGPTLGSHGGAALDTVDKVMERLQYRHDNREDVIANRISDLGIRWLDQGPERTESGYYANLEGKDLLLSRNALKTANKLIESRPTHWHQYQDHNAFPKALSHILDNRSNDGFLVRHNGLEVNAVLPASYKIKDANELLDGLLQPIKAIGEIQGISMIDEGDGDITSLRIIIGENIIPALRAEYGQYMMFLLNTSETGAISTKTILGLFRTICTNSAIRDQTRMAEWNHKENWDKFWDSTEQTLRDFSYLAPQFSSIFNGLLNSRLNVPASDLLAEFRNRSLITNEHFEQSNELVDQPTEDGRPVETQYDLFNVLTQGAQSLQSIASQHRAEQSALKIFTERGGLAASLEASFNRQRRSRARAGLPLVEPEPN